MNTIKCITTRKGPNIIPAPWTTEVFPGTEIAYDGVTKVFRFPYTAKITGYSLNITDGETVGSYNISRFEGMTPEEVVSKIVSCITGSNGIYKYMPAYKNPDAAENDPDLPEGAPYRIKEGSPGVRKNQIFIKITS